METIKTAVVVVLLLAVLYGVYVVLNRPDLGSSTEAVWDPNTTEPPLIEEGTPLDPNAALPGAPSIYAGSTLPETAQAPVGRTAEGMPSASVTDQVPTPADPPLGFESEAGPPPKLTPIPPATGEPEAAGPEGRAVRSVYDSATVYDSSAKGAMGMPSDDPAPDHGKSLSPQDETEDAGYPQPNRVFQNAWNAAVGQLEKEEWDTALLTLSRLYNDPDVTGEDRSRLMDLLDPLAGRVIYSSEHTIDPPYEVRPGETLKDIADRCQVPATLLQNINRIYDPNSLQPGTQLKDFRGPFRAEIDRNQSELVLFLGRRYAGRFAISVGNDPEPEPAEYQVQAKQPGREYYAPDRSRIPAKARDNPYGYWWIGLGGDVCIHGSTEPMPAHGGLGCVSLSSADAADVYQILTVGSKVLIR